MPSHWILAKSASQATSSCANRGPSSPVIFRRQWPSAREPIPSVISTWTHIPSGMRHSVAILPTKSWPSGAIREDVVAIVDEELAEDPAAVTCRVDGGRPGTICITGEAANDAPGGQNRFLARCGGIDNGRIFGPGVLRSEQKGTFSRLKCSRIRTSEAESLFWRGWRRYSRVEDSKRNRGCLYITLSRGLLSRCAGARALPPLVGRREKDTITVASLAKLSIIVIGWMQGPVPGQSGGDCTEASTSTESG